MNKAILIDFKKNITEEIYDEDTLRDYIVESCLSPNKYSNDGLYTIYELKVIDSSLETYLVLTDIKRSIGDLSISISFERESDNTVIPFNRWSFYKYEY